MCMITGGASIAVTISEHKSIQTTHHRSRRDAAFDLLMALGLDEWQKFKETQFLIVKEHYSEE